MNIFSVTRALARTLLAFTGGHFNIVSRPTRHMPRLQPHSIRQRLNTVASNVAQRSPYRRPRPIQKRRETIAVAVQTDMPSPQPIQKRRESVAVAVQTDMPSLEPVQKRCETVAVQDVAPENPVWCICRNEEYGEMILCENPICVIQWFHLDCMGLRTVPDGDWYCMNCQLLNKLS